jgi:ABC-type branched-subunit amino acid transport system substrate-binding protein
MTQRLTWPLWIGLSALACAHAPYGAEPEPAQQTAGKPPVSSKYAKDDTDKSTGVALPTAPRQNISQNPQADQALANTRARTQSSPKKAQVEALVRVWKAYPATTAGEDALYQAGTVAFSLGDYVSARRAFNELLFENPLYEHAPEAKEKLALAALETHAFRDAFQTLVSLAERARGDERRRLLEEADRAAEGAQMWGPALQIALEFAKNAGGAEREAALNRVAELVEAKVPVDEVAQAQANLDTDHPAWVLLTYKLARVAAHLRDFPQLEALASKLSSVAPNSVQAQKARELLNRAHETGKVAPRVVGVVLALTGKYKALGEAYLRGLQLAFKNSDITLVVKDSNGDVGQAAKAVESLALDEGAIAVIGPYNGDEARRAAVTAEDQGVPLLTMTRKEGITELGPHVFRNALTSSMQTRALVDYSVKVLGFKSFAMLYPSAAFGKELASDFWSDVAARGGEVRGAESYAQDQTTFKREAQKLVGRYYLDDRKDFVDSQKEIAKSDADSFRKRKALEKAKSSLEPIVDFDALFVPDYWDRVGLLAPALAVEDIITNGCDEKELENLKKTTGKDDLKTVTLLGVSTWSSRKNADGVPGLIERGGKYVHCSIYVDGFYVDSERPATRRFVRQYTEAYKDQEPPSLVEATAYDSGKMVRAVLDGAHPATREDFQRALAGLKGFEGATGRMSFSDKREAERELFFLTVDAKGVHELKPGQRPGQQPKG